MKHKSLLIFIIFSLMIASCEKRDYTGGTPRRQTFVKEAIQYFDSQVSDEELAAFNTSSPNLIQYHGEPMAVRIPAAGHSPNRFVLLYKKAGRFTSYRADVSGLHKLADTYEGTVSILDLKNQLLTRYTVEENKVTEIYDALQGRDVMLNVPSLSSPDNPYELEAVIVTPDRRDNSDYYNMFWFLNQDNMFRECYFPTDENMRNGGGESISEMEAAIVFAGPEHPIKDIKEELKCFTIDPKATYSVTVNVNQPVPGSRDLVNLSSSHNAGHAFLTLSEQQPNGNLIIRNIGFYPMHGAKPLNENDQSIFGDDSKTPFSVSLKISISANEFSALQATIYNLQKSNYDLNDNNCTTVIINTLNNINVHLPSTIGDTKLFRGNDPADLGEDIRGLDLKKFSNQNEGKQVIRNTSSKNSQFSPSKTGSCK